MPKPRARIIFVLFFAAAAPIAGVEAGETWWLEPQPPTPGPNQSVELELVAGDGYEGQPLELPRDDAARFQHIWRSGRENLPGEDAGRFSTREAGVELVVLDSARYFCKALLVVGQATPGSPMRWSEVGQLLEIVPQTDPVVLLRHGGELELQVLYDREPLAGATVRAVLRHRSESRLKRATTDEIGLARVVLDRAGSWMVEVAHSARCSSCAGGFERLSSTLVLAVGPSRPEEN